MLLETYSGFQVMYDTRIRFDDFWSFAALGHVQEVARRHHFRVDIRHVDPRFLETYETIRITVDARDTRDVSADEFLTMFRPTRNDLIDYGVRHFGVPTLESTTHRLSQGRRWIDPLTIATAHQGAMIDYTYGFVPTLLRAYRNIVAEGHVLNDGRHDFDGIIYRYIADPHAMCRAWYASDYKNGATPETRAKRELVYEHAQEAGYITNVQPWNNRTAYDITVPTMLALADSDKTTEVFRIDDDEIEWKLGESARRGIPLTLGDV
jgi:hypothetical protein